MLLLAFETSAKAASVALFEDEKLLAEQYQNTAMTHSQTLLVMAQDMLKQCGRTAREVEGIGVANGPGSFTGVRIGVAAAKGFAWGGEIPIYGVSTLEAMAYGSGVYNGYVCCAMDARRAQVYNALFYFERGRLIRQTPDRAIALTDLAEELKRVELPIFLVGDGSVLCYNTLKDTVPNLILPPECRQQQRAVGVALAAMAKKQPDDPAALAPNYLRVSQAERERNEKLQNK